MGFLGKAFKAVTGKGKKSDKGQQEDSAELSLNVVTGLKRVFKHLETQSLLPQKLYKEPGFVEEISEAERLINTGKISEKYLRELRSTHSIANSVVNVLSTHDPVIPKDLYDHFMSPMANLDELIDDLIKKEPLFDVVMQHLRYIVQNKSVNVSAGEIAAAVGIYILRASDDDSGIDSHSFEIQARVKTFEKILLCYIRSKEDAEAFFATANTPNRRSQSLNMPLVPAAGSNKTNTDSSDGIESSKRPNFKVPAQVPSFPTAPSPGKQSPPPFTPVDSGTIMQRSVKVTFEDPDALPTQDDLTDQLSRYGTVNNVGFKTKFAVVLFSSKQEAQACVRDLTEGSRFMGDNVKVKYLGGALDPPPSPQPSKQSSPVPVPTLQLPDPGEEVNIRHYSALPDAKAATEQTIRVSSPPRQPAREDAAGGAVNKSLLNTSGISAIENTSGWANASRASPPRGDKSFTLNTSNVSDFGEADVSLNQSASLQTVQSVKGDDRSHVSAASLPQTAVDRSAVSRSVLHDAAPGLNDSHLANNQSLRVQDLSMVSFAADVQEVDAPTTYTNHHDARSAQVHQTPSKARRYASDSSGGESPEDRAGEGETYPSAPGSGALLRPTRTVSPPKPQPRGPKLEDAGRLDSTGSSQNSWKSAQSSKSPDHASAKKAAKKNSFGYDTAEESGSDKSDTVNFASKSTGKFAKFSGAADSKASTVMRAYAHDVRDRSGSSSSESDVRQSSQLTTVTENGSAKNARFSTESAPGNAQYSVPNTARSQELLATPRSTTSAHSVGDQSATSSVKKRQIRTIHVGSPLNSGDHAAHDHHAHDDEENYIQEEQSEKMMRSRSNSEEVTLQVDKSLPNAHLHARFAEPEEVNESRVSHSRRKEESRQNRSTDRHASPPSKQSFQVQTSFVHEPQPSTRTRAGSDGSTASSRNASKPKLEPINTFLGVSTKHKAAEENNPEVMRLVQSLQERLRLLEAQVNLSAESESLRKASQARSEEAWTAEIIALSVHNQQTFAENTHLQEELQRLKIEFANAQAGLGAAEASKRSLLLNSEGLKDRAQHDALDTVISQKRLISALEQNLAETRRQSKKLEEDLLYMKDKHCTTASCLITWKAKALELSARQTMSSAGGTVRSLSSNVSGADKGSAAEARRVDDSDIMDRSLLAEVSGQRLRAESPVEEEEEGSVEHKSAEPDTHEKVQKSQSRAHLNAHSTHSASASKLHLSAHIGSVNESQIADDASREQLFPYDNTFFTDAGADNENRSHGSIGADVELDAQRRAAERITRQYIAKLPKQERISVQLRAQSNPSREIVAPQPFVPNALYAHLLPGYLPPAPAQENHLLAPPPRAAFAHQQEHQHQQQAVPPSPPRDGISSRGVSRLGDQPQRPELTEERAERAPILEDPADRISRREELRSASVGRRLQMHSTRTAHAAAPRMHELRPTEGNERFALLMQKRSRSPELRRSAFISPMVPLQHIPLAAEMIECEQRLQSLSRAKAAPQASLASRSAYHPIQEANMYATLARSYHSEGLSAFSGRSLHGNRLGNSLSRSYTSSGHAGNPFSLSVGSFGGESRSSGVGRSLESGTYRGAVHSDRLNGAPLWAQHKYT